jgi:hypothetical protein
MIIPPETDEERRRLYVWSARQGFGPTKEGTRGEIYDAYHCRSIKSLGVLAGIRDPADGWTGSRREVRVRNGTVQMSRPGKGNPWLDVVDPNKFARHGRRAIYY